MFVGNHMAKSVDKEGLSEDGNLREKYDEKYKKLSKEYSRLGKIVHQDLEKLLEDANISVLSVTYRIKDFDKFLDKIKRKKYKNPLNEIEDICGLRIVCYYTSDLDKIASIIKKEFIIVESIDKSKVLGEDEFGYLSHHFIVKLKANWLNTPSYRDLGHLKAEIQLRTVLMHTWADISHKLSYKKKEQAPHQFTRRLNRLSAILEEADEKFDSLRRDREKYIEEISGKSVKSSGFDLKQELNLDSILAFLDFYFPDRGRNIDETTLLLDEILRFNKEYNKKISFETILKAYNTSKEKITINEIRSRNKMTKANVERLKENDPIEFDKLSRNSKYYIQAGIVRVSLTYYYKDYEEYLEKLSFEENNNN